jgi:hypothetical protein
MDRATISDFHLLGALLGSERAGELNLPFDPIDLSHLGLALGAIDRVNLRMVQRNRYTIEWPALALRIERDCHRCARAERGQKKIVRGRPGICSAERKRLIAFESMRTDLNLLRKARAAAANDYAWRIVRSVSCHCWKQ